MPWVFALRPEQRTHVFEVLGGVHSGRRPGRDRGPRCDSRGTSRAIARALRPFPSATCPAWDRSEEFGAIRVQPDVPHRATPGRPLAAPSGRCGEASRAPRNRRAREVKRARLRVEHDLDHVRVEDVRGVVDRCAQWPSGLASAEQVGARRISAGSISGSSPCTLTTMSSPSPSSEQPRQGGRVPRRGRRASSRPRPRARGCRDHRARPRRSPPAMRRTRAPGARPAPPSADRRYRPAACPAIGSTPAAPKRGR